MKLSVINTGLFKLDGGAMFGVVPKTIWSKLNTPDQNNLCTWAMRCLLLEFDDRRVLIDSGLGNKQSEKFFSYYEPHGDNNLIDSLARAGASPESITDVFHTHLHFDHCGGSIHKNADGHLTTTFPNATYWSNQEHWDWAVNPNPREKASFLGENILPMQESGQMKMVDVEPMIELFPGFKIKFVYGHTKAMMIPHIEVNGKTIVYMADLLPSPAHIPIPYVMAYDTNPLITMQEKSVFVKEAYENDYILFFEHDKSIECCKVIEKDGKYKSSEGFTLAEVLAP